MPNRSNIVRRQARWPRNTPGGLGGQWRPDGLHDAAAELLVGAAQQVDAAGGTRAQKAARRALISNANSQLAELDWTGRSWTVAQARVAAREIIRREIVYPLRDSAFDSEIFRTRAPRSETSRWLNDASIEGENLGPMRPTGRARAPRNPPQPHLAESPARSRSGRIRNLGAMTDENLRALHRQMYDLHSVNTGSGYHAEAWTQTDPDGHERVEAEMRERDMDPADHVPTSVNSPIGRVPRENGTDPQAPDDTGGRYFGSARAAAGFVLGSLARLSGNDSLTMTDAEQTSITNSGLYRVNIEKDGDSIAVVMWDTSDGTATVNSADARGATVIPPADPSESVGPQPSLDRILEDLGIVENARVRRPTIAADLANRLAENPGTVRTQSTGQRARARDIRVGDRMEIQGRDMHATVTGLERYRGGNSPGVQIEWDTDAGGTTDWRRSEIQDRMEGSNYVFTPAQDSSVGDAPPFSDMAVLRQVYAEHAITADDLANHFQVERSAVNRALRRLERAGQVSGDMAETETGLESYHAGGSRRGAGRFTNRLWQPMNSHDDVTWEEAERIARDAGVSSRRRRVNRTTPNADEAQGGDRPGPGMDDDTIRGLLATGQSTQIAIVEDGNMYTLIARNDNTGEGIEIGRRGTRSEAYNSAMRIVNSASNDSGAIRFRVEDHRDLRPGDVTRLVVENDPRPSYGVVSENRRDAVVIRVGGVDIEYDRTHLDRIWRSNSGTDLTAVRPNRTGDNLDTSQATQTDPIVIDPPDPGPDAVELVSERLDELSDGSSIYREDGASVRRSGDTFHYHAPDGNARAVSRGQAVAVLLGGDEDNRVARITDSFDFGNRRRFTTERVASFLRDATIPTELSNRSDAAVLTFPNGARATILSGRQRGNFNVVDADGVRHMDVGPAVAANLITQDPIEERLQVTPSSTPIPDNPDQYGDLVRGTRRWGPRRFPTAQALGDWLIELADSQMPGSETSGFTAEVAPNGRSVKLVMQYTDPITGREVDQTIAIAYHRQGRISFRYGSDAVLDGFGEVTTGSNRFAPRSHRVVRLRASEEARAQMGRALLVASRQLRRANPTVPQPVTAGSTSREGEALPGVEIPGMAAANGRVILGDGSLERRTFGIENEFYSGGTQQRDTAHQHRAFVADGLPSRDYGPYYNSDDVPPDLWAVSGDAGGIEIGTPVLAGELGLGLVERTWRLLNEAGGRQMAVRQGGIHVHIGVDDLSRRQIDEVADGYLDNWENIEMLIAPNREGSQYSPRGRGTLSHYHAINTPDVSGRQTIEFRRMGNSMDGNLAVIWIQFLRAFTQWTKENGQMSSQDNLGSILSLLVASGHLSDSVRNKLLARARSVSSRSNGGTSRAPRPASRIE